MAIGRAVLQVLALVEPVVHGANAPVYSLLRYPSFCGVMGGLGPEATANFFLDGVIRGQNRLFTALQDSARHGDSFEEQRAAVALVSTANWSVAEIQRLSIFPSDIRSSHWDDQQHIPLLIYNHPQTPGRPDWILSQNRTGLVDPRPFLLSSARQLVRGGANCLCMICNTAHYFLPYVRDRVPTNVRMLDMLQLTVEAALRASPRRTDTVRLGLLATTATIDTRIYPDAASAVSARLQREVLIVSPFDAKSGNQSAVTEAIFGPSGLKAGFADLGTLEGQRNFELLYGQAAVLRTELGVDVVVAACTEIPLVLTQVRVSQRNPSLRLLDPTKVLADEVVRQTLIARQLRRRSSKMKP